MTNYESAADYLAAGRNHDRRQVSGIRGTVVHRIDADTIALRYQDTDVVRWYADGTASLHTGGWRTATTKSRINEYSKARLYTVKGIWYVQSSAFVEGMRIDADGHPIDPQTTTPEVDAAKRLDKAVAKYITGYARTVCHGPEPFPEPSNGDCWGCLFSLQGANGQTETGHLTPQGYTRTTDSADPLGVDHLLSHMTEAYYVPSLYARACVEAHYGGGPAIGWQMGIARKDAAWIRRELRRYFRQPQRRAALIAAVVAGGLEVQS